MTDIADPERALILAYVPADRRAALATLWRLDERLGAIVAATREPMAGRIRLAWWREALETLDRAAPPPEPLLRDIAVHVAPLLTPGRLAAIEPGWSALLDPPDAEVIAAHGRERGGALFRIAGLLLGGEDGRLQPAGEGWALADLAHRHSDPAVRERARAGAEAALADVRGAWPKPLRPLAGLVAMARHDAHTDTRRQGSPVRIIRMLAAIVTGR